MSVFEEENNNSSVNLGVNSGSEGASDLDKLNNILKNIKNENGEQKYSTLDKALEALLHSQQYIPQLKTEISSKEREIELMKQQLDNSNSVENLLNSFKEQEQQTEPVQKPNELDISQLVLKTIEEREKNNIKVNNIKTVDNHLVNLYGDKAAEVMRKKASELGVTPKQLAELSETSPAIVINLFKPETNTTVTPLKSGANIGITQPVQTQFEQKNLMRGAKTKDIVDYVSKIKQAVYEKYDIK